MLFFISGHADWPSARQYGAFAIDRRNESLVLYGGEGITNPSTGTDVILSDLWTFDWAAKKWTLLNSKVNDSQVTPRFWSNSWSGLDGTLWLSGGSAMNGFGATDKCDNLLFNDCGEQLIQSFTSCVKCARTDEAVLKAGCNQSKLTALCTLINSTCFQT